MPSASKAEIFKYQNFNISALCQLASKLRGGQICICNPTQIPLCGSFNWAIKIAFIDGVEWMLRSPRSCGASKRRDTNLLLLASEAATLKFIKANSSIPVPEVFAYSCSDENEIGIPYILMSKANGFPLQQVWRSSGSTKESDISQEQKAKVLYQLGIITAQLSHLQSNHAGSIFEEGGEFCIKTCLSRSLLVAGRDELEDINRGPYHFERDYYEAQISAHIEHVKYLSLGHHCLFAPIPARHEYKDRARFLKASRRWSDFVTVQEKTESSENRVDHVVAGEILSFTIANWNHKLIGVVPSDWKHRFALHHPDLSVNNIFVDEDMNITCIIDWAFCSTVPLSMVLVPPGLPQSRYEVGVLLLPAFEDGLQSVLLHGTYQQDHIKRALCRILSCSRQMWLLSRILNFDSLTDYNLYEALWALLERHNEDMLGFFKSKQSADDYTMLYKELKEEDRPTEQIAKQEKDYFRNDVSKLAVARHLSMVSQWSSRYGHQQPHGIRRNGRVFVADKKLWTWVGHCLDPNNGYP